MKSLIIIHSYHHNNTLKIAHAIADVLDADVKTCEQANIDDIAEYDLIGFGAGIDSGKHYKILLDFADDIPTGGEGRKCFVFSTSAIYSQSKMQKDHATLDLILKCKGYDILGEFSCKGFNTNSFLKYIGGMNKEHPDGLDIINAKQFAIDIKTIYENSNTQALCGN